MAEIKWTNEQQRVIDARNKNLLVSASAGSGKTTVMIARVLDLMLKEKVSISNFLIVTFTKASATDMKKKLIDELLKLEPSDFVLEQIDSVATSDISDLHSFYSKLISTYFYELDIDPKQKIIDETDSSILKERAITRLFEKKEKEGDANFFEIFDFFQKKRNDKTLKNMIYSFDNFLNSLIDGETWFKEKLESAYNENLQENVCANDLNQYVSQSVLEDAELAEKYAEKCASFGCITYAEHFYEIASLLKSVKQSNSFLVNAKNIFELDIPRTPTKIAEEHKFLQEETSQIKGKIKKNIENYRKNYISADASVLTNGLRFGKRVLQNLYELVKEFNEQYSQIKKEINGLDFNDLERYALKILENKDILQAVKDKYTYVFVDEYQDVNEVQEYIISKVSSPSNRFMVGDVKQSIYGFRLSDPEIFLNKYKDYNKDMANSEVVHLNANFRSDKYILKFVDDVFSGVMTPKFGGIDYAKDSKFVPGENNLCDKSSVNLCFIDTSKEKKEESVLPEIYSVKNHTQTEEAEALQAVAEANYVVSKISELVDVNKKEHLNYSDIAILVASRNAFTKKFIEVLKSFEIPVSSDEKYDLLSKSYIQEILNFVKLVVSEKDDILLFKVLKSKMFRFEDNELVQIRKINHSVRFCEAIFEYENLDDEKLKQKVKDFFEKLERFKNLAKFLTLKEFAKKIIQEFCLYEINLTEIDGALINDEIDTFLSKLPEKNVFEFVLNYENFELEYQGECAGDTVKVMTIHKSKGLEFKAVFLVNTSNEFNMQSTFGSILFNKDYGAAINYFDYDSRAEVVSIPMSAISAFSKRKLVAEQQRLLYVALTRAIQKLFVVCSKPKANIEAEFALRPKSFICWFEPMIVKALENKNDEYINFESYEIDELSIVQTAENKQLLLSATEGIIQEELKYKYSESCSVPLKSSVSKILHNKENNYALNSEDADNQEENRLSEDLISAADRGTIYHKVFENIDLKNLSNLDEQLQEIKNKHFSENERKEIDDKLIKSALSQSVFAEIENGDKILKEREFCAYVPAKLVNENADKDDNFVLQGVIDLVIAKPDGLIILDYKTGKCSNEKLEKYKFQLDTYAEVAERAFQMKVTKKYLLFIDEEKLKEI